MHAFLTRIDPKQNMNRWYLVVIQPNLFNELTIFTAWGGRASGGMRFQMHAAASMSEAVKFARGIVRSKVGKGYQIGYCAAELRPKE